MNSDAAHSLIPAKFMAIGTQLILSITVLFSEENNLNEYRNTPSYDSQRSTLRGQVIAGIAILLVDLFLMFTGITLFKRQSLLFQCYFHLAGCFFGLYFIIDTWKADDYFSIFLAGILLPFSIEVLQVILVKIYKKQVIE